MPKPTLCVPSPHSNAAGATCKIFDICNPIDNGEAARQKLAVPSDVDEQAVSFSGCLREAFRQERAAKVAVCIGLSLLVWLGFYQAFYFPIWSPIDEGAHYSFIQTIVLKGRLPVLGQDYVEDEVIAISARVYPGKWGRDVRAHGVAGHSYEAFQPPLFYLTATPVFALSGPNAITRVVWLRMFGWSLFLSSFLFVYLILRERLGTRWPYAALVALGFYGLPSVVVRNTTISNCCLEAPLLGMFLFCSLFAPKSWGLRKYILGSLALGLLLLTKLTTVYLVALQGGLIVRELAARGESRSTRLRRIAILAGVPAFLLACWLIRNLLVHGSFTANKLMMQMIAPIVNPSGAKLPWSQIKDHLFLMFTPFPEEWSAKLYPLLTWQKSVLLAALVALPMVANVRAAIARQWRLVILLSLPIAGLSLLVFGSVMQNWDAMCGRYLYSCLPFFGAGLGIASHQWLKKPGSLVAAGGVLVCLMSVWNVVRIAS